jgi:hypothetical protein
MRNPKEILVDKIFTDLIDIGNEIEEDDDIIQELRENWAVKGEGMSVVIEITLSQPTAKNPDPKPFYTSCFTMVNGYPTKIPVPLNPHVRIKMDLMCLKFILRGYRHYKGPNGRLKVKYGFRRAYGEERLFKQVRNDVHYLSDAGLVDKVIELLEFRIFPRFRNRNKGKWIMKDS